VGVALRPRRAEDLPALLAVLQRTHEQESYPVRPEAVSGGWLASGAELWSAVAVDGDRVVGHVALHPAGADDAGRQWAAATGAPVDRLAVVSRLFTDRTVRGSGAALLDAAVHAAQVDGRTPVLLVDPDGAARDWYRRRAWRAIGTSRQQWGPRTVDAVLLLPP
jgi:GNAT superfamily N-acetyltransferase